MDLCSSHVRVLKYYVGHVFFVYGSDDGGSGAVYEAHTHNTSI